MAGNNILLTGRNGTHYQLSVVSKNLWSRTLTNNKCNRLFESGIMAIIKVTKRNVSALSVNERVGLLSAITRLAGLFDLQHMVMTSAEGILFPRLLTFQPNPSPCNSCYFVWIEGCQYNDNYNSDKKMSIINKNVEKILGNTEYILIPIYKLFEKRQKYQRYKRSIFVDKRYHSIITLPILRINILQIMNFNIPPNLFQNFPYPYEIQVFQSTNNSRSILNNDKISWISFNPSTRNIRFKPTPYVKGLTNLEICTNSSIKNESCAFLQIFVTSSNPQVHQIHIRQGRNDYIINYTLPIVWFGSQKVMKDSQIKITAITASIPIVWTNNNYLLFLNLSSVEGTVLEIMVDVIVNNETFVQLELMMPLMSLAKTKPIIYQFRTIIKWLFSQFSSKILLFQLKTVLEKMASELHQLLIKTTSKSLKISILPLHIYGDPFNYIFIQNEIITFDWTFSINSDLPSDCIIDSNQIIMLFSKLQILTYKFVNISTIKSKIYKECGLLNNIRTTTTVSIKPTSSTRMSLVSKMTSSAMKKDSNWKLISIPTMKFSVECGRIFQYALPTDLNGIPKLKIIPVVFTGPKPDWITFFEDKQIVGVIAKSRCPKNEFHFRILGLNQRRNISMEMKLIIEVIENRYSPDNKFQIDLIFKSVERYYVGLIIRAIQCLYNHIKSNCQNDLNCDFKLTLLRSSLKNDGTAHFSLGYLENSTNCPQTLAIFLRNQIILLGNHKPSVANSFLVRSFYQHGLGQLIHSSFLLNSICQNKNIFPPDLGQIIVYNNIPSTLSLQPFIDFYNHSVIFLFAEQFRNPYLYWMKMSNDSLTLFILASTEHVRSQPYIVELAVYPDNKHRMLLPKIAVEVRNLMHHPAFHPFIRELNHQISVDISVDKSLVDSDLPLILTLELCEMIDKYLRNDCTQISKNDCGTDILVFINSNVEIQNISNINYKLSSLSILENGRSSSYNDIYNQKVICPLQLLNQMEIKLKYAFHEYRKMSNTNRSWTLESFKVLYMGSCVHTETAYIRVKDEIAPKPIKIPIENKFYFENTQQMFLMATVIPACSFIFITLLLGLATACLLNRRSRKKHLFNSATLKVHRHVPIIFQSETDAYSPPSKPLILQNEKPPQPPPEDEDEDDVILLPSIHSMKFFRSTI